jgi:hypothetical protein
VIDEGLRWATTPVASSAALVTVSAAGQALQPFEYVVAHADGEQASAAGGPRPIPDAAWDEAIASGASVDEYAAIARAAAGRGRDDVAERARAHGENAVEPEVSAGAGGAAAAATAPVGGPLRTWGTASTTSSGTLGARVGAVFSVIALPLLSLLLAAGAFAELLHIDRTAGRANPELARPPKTPLRAPYNGPRNPVAPGGGQHGQQPKTGSGSPGVQSQGSNLAGVGGAGGLGPAVGGPTGGQGSGGGASSNGGGASHQGGGGNGGGKNGSGPKRAHSGNPHKPSQNAADGRYIVVLASAANPAKLRASRAPDPADHAARLGAKPTHVYRYALSGYSAKLSHKQLKKARADKDVAFVEPDGRPTRALQGGTAGPEIAQRIPTGVQRIGANESSAVAGDGSGETDATVAVIGTGVSPHPDLNLVKGTNCGSGGPSHTVDDRNDSTSAAGLIGARDNAFGVVGVAPGARIAPVRIREANGLGTWSAAICGLDWIAGTRTDGDPGNDVDVALLDIVGPGYDDGACGKRAKDAVHAAVCRTVDRGVTVVAPAGNCIGPDCTQNVFKPDIYYSRPGAYREVLTVTGMADFDGEPGGRVKGRQPVCTRFTKAKLFDSDDTYLDISQYATRPFHKPNVIAAPGACVETTTASGGYDGYTGTAPAASLVAGTAALCIASGRCATDPRKVARRLITDAEQHLVDTEGAYGFSGDPFQPANYRQGWQRYFGYLVYAGGY